MSKLAMTGMIVVAKEVGGLEMGVLQDGTPFLTGRGLAKACGVAPSAIIQQAKAWASGRRGALGKLLADAGYEGSSLYVPATRNGRHVHAYIDSVSTIVIAYYAFDAESPNQTAINTARLLIQDGLRKFIYDAVGYDERSALSPDWREFHDRLMLATAPPKFFSVLRELAEFVLRAIHAGLQIGSDTIPDVSVGIVWGKHWEDNNLAAKYGERRRWEHNYPDYYPQAGSNPQESWAYPRKALGAFHDWLDDVYAPEKFPKYIEGKVKRRELGRSDADRLLAAMVPAQLSDGEDDDDEDDDDDQ